MTKRGVVGVEVPELDPGAAPAPPECEARDDRDEDEDREDKPDAAADAAAAAKRVFSLLVSDPTTHHTRTRESWPAVAR